MPPGAGKSPVYRVLTKPLNTLEERLQRGARADVYAAEERRRQLEARITKAQKSEDADPDEVAAMRAQLDDLEQPCAPRLLAEDATPEALVELLHTHHGRMSLISDEGGVFDMMGGQYAEKGRTANLAVYLQGWSAGTIRRDRRSSTPIVIPEAILNVVVATQPGVVARIAENVDLAGRGLTARFMYAIPPSLVGYRDRRAVLTHLDAALAGDFDRRIEELGWRLAGNLTPTVLTTTVDATHRFLEWDQTLEARQRPNGDLADMAEWCSKLRASVLRVAGLIHIAEGNTASTPIDVPTLERAIEVGVYWMGHARAVHALWRDDPALRAARLIATWAAETTTAPSWLVDKGGEGIALGFLEGIGEALVDGADNTQGGADGTQSRGYFAHLCELLATGEEGAEGEREEDMAFHKECVGGGFFGFKRKERQASVQ
jgi:hypothetical protein